MSKRNRSSQSIVQKVGSYKPDVVATALRVVRRNGEAGLPGFVSGFFSRRVWSEKAMRKATRRGKALLQTLTDAELVKPARRRGGVAVTDQGAEYVKAFDAAAAIFGVRAVRKIVSVYMNDKGAVKHRKRSGARRRKRTGVVTVEMSNAARKALGKSSRGKRRSAGARARNRR